ncbi:hypothetical protein LB533_20630 [Mesorhizobium sp. BR1-1-13]|uniref:hypothetical protein n=1 Tax=Mesorhizobium sp. BR1-1-13 TaxID=2876656 RepID=UPI001CD17C95|nr:hypothetical protein [Mesorhizobium sp. BR1-1-13]MBZ9943496.1 hypothetical protein [Mesorhizobium sp. BR1-1-13]
MTPANDNAAIVFRPLDGLSLFATEKEVATAIVGKSGAEKWIREVLPVLRRRGFPASDALHARLAVPLVKRFYEGYFGQTAGFAVAKPDGEEKLGLDQWKTRNKKKG